MKKFIGKSPEFILEMIENGSATVADLKAERDSFGFLCDVDPRTEEFKASSDVEKKLFFDWCELNRAIEAMSESVKTLSDVDSLGNFEVDEF